MTTYADAPFRLTPYHGLIRRVGTVTRKDGHFVIEGWSFEGPGLSYSPEELEEVARLKGKNECLAPCFWLLRSLPLLRPIRRLRRQLRWLWPRR